MCCSLGRLIPLSLFGWVPLIDAWFPSACGCNLSPDLCHRAPGCCTPCLLPFPSPSSSSSSAGAPWGSPPPPGASCCPPADKILPGALHKCTAALMASGCWQGGCDASQLPSVPSWVPPGPTTATGPLCPSQLRPSPVPPQARCTREILGFVFGESGLKSCHEIGDSLRVSATVSQLNPPKHESSKAIYGGLAKDEQFGLLFY